MVATVFIDDVGFKHSMASGQLSEALATILASRTAARQLRGELESAISMSPEKGIAATTEFLASDNVVLAAAIKANTHLSERNRASLEGCLAMPSFLSVQSPLKEVSRVRARLKASGNGVRVTHDFGLQHRTSQGMVLRVMECHFVPRSFQYTFRGIGKAIATAKVSLAQGLSHFATLDIKDHFGSFDPAKLASVLPLPIEWVDHVVVGRHLAVAAETGTGPVPNAYIPTDMLLIQASLGVPQGSACSSIVAAFCMAQLQWESFPGTAMSNYADNFLLLAPTAQARDESIDKLAAAIAELPGGHFHPTIVQEGQTKFSGVDYLGHNLALKGSKVCTTISIANQEAVFGKMRKLEHKFHLAKKQGDNAKALAHVKKMCAFLKGWVHAFRECDDISTWEDSLLYTMQKNVGSFGEQVPHLYETVGGDFRYNFREYAWT